MCVCVYFNQAEDKDNLIDFSLRYIFIYFNLFIILLYFYYCFFIDWQTKKSFISITGIIELIILLMLFIVSLLLSVWIHPMSCDIRIAWRCSIITNPKCFFLIRLSHGPSSDVVCTDIYCCHHLFFSRTTNSPWTESQWTGSLAELATTTPINAIHLRRKIDSFTKKKKKNKRERRESFTNLFIIQATNKNFQKEI